MDGEWREVAVAERMVGAGGGKGEGGRATQSEGMDGKGRLEYRRKENGSEAKTVRDTCVPA